MTTISENNKILTSGAEKLALLEFNQDKTEAYISIFPSEDGKVIKPEEIISALYHEGVLNIDTEIIHRAVKDNQFNRRILVARGILPTKGKDAYFLYQFGSSEKGDTIEVIPGQILGVKVFPQEGTSGITVTGEVIPPLIGQDIEIIPGKNTAISPDGLKVYATSFGAVNWIKNKVEVERILEIPNDIDENEGNIDFQGSVIIGGEVKDGFRVKATGNIQIGKNVGKAILESEAGNVYINGQVMPGAQIKAANDIIALSIKNATLETKGNVRVKEELIDSYVIAQRVLLQENKGLICGGKIIAHSLIEAKVIGHKDKTTTLIVDEDGKISASSSIYPGTKIEIGNISIEIRQELKKVSYHKISNSIIQSQYEPTLITEEVILPSEPQIYLDNFPPSVVVKANSLSQAKEIGGEILNLPPGEIDCQTGIVEGDNSLIRVFPLGVKGPWEEGWRKRIREEISRTQVEDVDGMFEFFNTDMGLYLSVVPPKGSGKEVTLEDVLDYVEKKGFVEVNRNLIKKAVENPSFKPMLVGARQRLLDLDGQVEVEVAPDYSKAAIIVRPPKPGGLPASFEDALAALREHDVIVGIDEKAVAKAIFAQSNRPVLVAEAIPPTSGEPAKLEYRFRTDRSKVELVEDEYGRVDFKKLNLIENVRAGQVLVVKRPPGKGKPGKLINGLEIPALPGQDVKMPVGRNTEVSKDGTELIATINGQVLLVGDKVNVEDTIEIKGDVGLQTGNIYFLGTILIEGNVEDGFEVEATGDIQIKKSVGKCFISAGGSIAIGEGVKGKGAARLFAGGHIFAKYIENAKVEAKGTIQVTQEIMHSQADAGKAILLEGKQRGSIIGGRARAGDEIHAREIGAPAGTATKIEVGGTPRIREQLDNLNRLYHKDIHRLETVKKDIATLQLKKSKEQKNFSLEMETKLQRLIREHNKLTVKLQRYTDQKEFLEMRIEESLGGIISVSHTLFQGVTVTIRNATLKIKDNYNSVSLGPKGDEVGIFPYGMAK